MEFINSIFVFCACVCLVGVFSFLGCAVLPTFNIKKLRYRHPISLTFMSISALFLSCNRRAAFIGCIVGLGINLTITILMELNGNRQALG